MSFPYSPLHTITPANSRPRFSLKQTADAAVEPVTLAEAKAHMNITDGNDDNYIPGLIKGARRRLENEMRRALITQTWRFHLDHFPFFRQRTFPVGYMPIELPRPPLLAITSLKYMDPTDPTGQTLLTLTLNTDFIVDSNSEPARIQSIGSNAWPATLRQIGAVQIIYTAGYGPDATTVPEDIKMAIMQVVAHWYENRESVFADTGRGLVMEIPQTAMWLIEPYMVEHFWEE